MIRKVINEIGIENFLKYIKLSQLACLRTSKAKLTYVRPRCRTKKTLESLKIFHQFEYKYTLINNVNAYVWLLKASKKLKWRILKKTGITNQTNQPKIHGARVELENKITVQNVQELQFNNGEIKVVVHAKLFLDINKNIQDKR